MSMHYAYKRNLNDKACWNCEHCSCQRKIDNNGFSSTAFMYESKGICNSKRSDKRGKEVDVDHGRCFDFSLSQEAQSILLSIRNEELRKENKKEQKRIEEENRTSQRLNAQRIEVSRKSEESNPHETSFGTYSGGLSWPKQREPESLTDEEITRINQERAESEKNAALAQQNKARRQGRAIATGAVIGASVFLLIFEALFVWLTWAFQTASKRTPSDGPYGMTQAQIDRDRNLGIVFEVVSIIYPIIIVAICVLVCILINKKKKSAVK